MSRYFPCEAQQIMCERFGHDCLISLATADGDTPFVRTVNAYYAGGAFYVITHALSNKMLQIGSNPKVAICGDWFTAQGVGENMGHVASRDNQVIAQTLRQAFAAWYDNGHTDESDPNTCILRIRLVSGVLYSHGTRYDIVFDGQDRL